MLNRTLAALGLAAIAPALASAQIVTGFSATLSGVEETPPNSSTELATADLSYNVATGELTCVVATTMSTVTVAHLHDGDVGSGGPIVFGLSPIAGGWGGSGILTTAQLEDLLRGGLYLNLHSATFPGGELRGQVRAPRHFLSFADGAKELPPNPSTGTAEGVFELDLATFQISYDVVAFGMTATVAHIHRGFAGSGGPVVVNMTSVGPNAFAGTSAPLVVDDVVQLLLGGMYLNVHSAAFPAGELRDQLAVGGLNQDTNRLGAANGIRLEMSVNAGQAAAGSLYWILGSLSGTTPGLPVDGVTLALNPDAYFFLTLGNPNLAPLSVSQGLLTGGQDLGLFEVGPGVLSGLVGSTIDHAFIAIDLVALTVTYASNPQSIEIL